MHRQHRGGRYHVHARSSGHGFPRIPTWNSLTDSDPFDEIASSLRDHDVWKW